MKGSTSARGYGYKHRQIRKQLLAQAYGRDCVHCGDVMQPGQALDLDHTDDRKGYRGFAHARCNRSDGASKGNAQRKAPWLMGGRSWLKGDSPSEITTNDQRS